MLSSVSFVGNVVVVSVRFSYVGHLLSLDIFVFFLLKSFTDMFFHFVRSFHVLRKNVCLDSF